MVTVVYGGFDDGGYVGGGGEGVGSGGSNGENVDN